MLPLLLKRLFSKKRTPDFNPEQTYCQHQRHLQHQVRLAQQAAQAPVPPALAARPKVAKTTLELVGC
ncbi:MAG: hypothetical protein EOO63_13220 [Hymenobacter sp.]|nr:MAG: hypothetical protein EOO63_13220 [Hymenobacter sp.]